MVEKESKVCSVEGCDTPNNTVRSIDGIYYCHKHYMQIKRNGHITGVKSRLIKQHSECLVEGCLNKPVSRGYCSKHSAQIRKFGRLVETRYDKNEIFIKEDYAEIVLKDNNLEEKARVIIDLEDLDKVKTHKWHIISSGYAYCTTLGILLHRYLLGLNKDNEEYVDHENRNKLDCRKSNLRIANDVTNSQNSSISSKNTSGFIGVSHTKNNKWRAYIHKNLGFKIKSKYIQLGTFETKEEALISRLKAEKEMFGEFAPQKHLFEKYNI